MSFSSVRLIPNVTNSIYANIFSRSHKLLWNHFYVLKTEYSREFKSQKYFCNTLDAYVQCSMYKLELFRDNHLIMIQSARRIQIIDGLAWAVANVPHRAESKIVGLGHSLFWPPIYESKMPWKRPAIIEPQFLSLQYFFQIDWTTFLEKDAHSGSKTAHFHFSHFELQR